MGPLPTTTRSESSGASAAVHPDEGPHPAEYVPATRWVGGHRMTIFTWARPRAFPRLPTPEARYLDVAPDARVLAHCYWQPDRAHVATLMVLHGLEGSSSAHYMRGIADKAFSRGLNVVLLNQRNCGGTEHLSKGLYHSGLTHDPLTVMRLLREQEGLGDFGVAGYSLGGNLTLKIAGERAAERAPFLRVACAVSPTMDLALCVDALERPANVLYQWNFVRNLRARMRRKARAWPRDYDLAVLRGVWTVRQFDEVLTAPHHGFESAADYYYRASSLRVVDRIDVPTLIISAADDPFVPPEQFGRPEVTGNAKIHVTVTPFGGHCGFLSDDRSLHDGYWAEHTLVRFVAHHLGVTSAPSPVRA